MISNRNLFLSHLGQTTTEPLLIEIDRAEGIWLYGPDGRKYLDLVSGVSVSNIGHANPAVIEAVKNQLDKYMHLMVYGELIQSPQVNYAQSIIKQLPGQFETVYFVNSGSEAIEGAIKTARRYTGRTKLVSFLKAYHGSTLGAVSLFGDNEFRAKFMPLLPETYQIPFNNTESLLEIDNNTAAVVIEPIQAEAGIILPEDDFLGKVRKRCDETGALLIFDEIQTGFGRTGSLFAFERYNVVPDILCLAKSLGGGMPLGAFVSSKEIISILSDNPALGHITTFGGHPVCCTAGKAVLDIIVKEELYNKANEKGRRFRNGMKHDAIISVRGEGLFLAVQLKSDELAKRFVAGGTKNGLILDQFLFCKDSFRIAPPLTINNDEIDYTIEIILEILDKLS